jgi:predicted phage terminase large subunit-like protein
VITSRDKDGIAMLGPQPGPQTTFTETSADIAIYGGEAGGGKSVGIIFEAGRHVQDNSYTGVIFRRKYKEIVDGGGLWDTSMQVYPHLGGVPTRGSTEWRWFNNNKETAKIKFNHLNREKDAYDHQGAAYAFLGFDELTHFERFQFFYLLTRNRPAPGCMVRPYCRATCNADADSWVADLIQWWWDKDTGYPIRERSGKLRYFTIEDDNVIWVPKTWRHPKTGLPPRSFTFIAARLSDNKLMAHRDIYEAGLDAQDRVTRERLKEGNWLISYAGNMFRGEWFQIVEKCPEGIRRVRYWDFAASEVKEGEKKDPDWTAGALCGIHDGVLYIIDMITFRETPGKGEKLIRNAAVSDGHDVEIWWEEEKGSSGKWTSEYLKNVFQGYESHPDPVSGSKVERAKPWSAWAEFGRVKLVRGDWNKRFIGRAGKFPEGKRDEIDAVSGCFKALVGPKRVFSRYIPNSTGHLRMFSIEKEDFEKISPDNVKIYIALWAEKDGGIYGGCFIWSVINKRLRLYNEIFMPSPTANELLREIIGKLVVSVEQKNGWVGLHKIIGNEDFFTDRYESIAKTIRKASNIRIRKSHIYDENSAILKCNQMFASNQIICHEGCVESDIQWRGWLYEDKKVAEGSPLARALCLVVNEIRGEGEMAEQRRLVPYSKAKMDLRENLKSKSGTKYINVDRDKKMNEYLTR